MHSAGNMQPGMTMLSSGELKRHAKRQDSHISNNLQAALNDVEHAPDSWRDTLYYFKEVCR